MALPEMEIVHQRSLDGEREMIGVSMHSVMHSNGRLLAQVLTIAAEKIADKYVEEHYQEIVAHIRPEAIATLAVANAGAEINHTLKEEVQTRTREVVKREVHQRGIFGSMRRVF